MQSGTCNSEWIWAKRTCTIEVRDVALLEREVEDLESELDHRVV